MEHGGDLPPMLTDPAREPSLQATIPYANHSLMMMSRSGPTPTIPPMTSPDPRVFLRMKIALENLLPQDATERFKFQIPQQSPEMRGSPARGRLFLFLQAAVHKHILILIVLCCADPFANVWYQKRTDASVCLGFLDYRLCFLWVFFPPQQIWVCGPGSF